MNRIDETFVRLRREGSRALVPFLTAGDPDLATTAALVREVVARGAHIVELGIPYSDPVTDGPVIAASYTRALGRGFHLSNLWPVVSELRAGGLTAPLVTMVSYAIVLRHGLETYVREAAEAGIDGLIVPDLPVEEADRLADFLREHDLRSIQLVAPTTPPDRALQIAKSASGFLYYISVAGITGERREFSSDLAERVGWLRSHTDLPICIGFGISRPEHVRQLSPIADGLIVGSAIVRRVAEHAGRPTEELVRDVGDFVAELAAALR